jgi:hypothetical protein
MSLASSDLSQWPKVDTSPLDIGNTPRNQPSFCTISLPGRGHKLRLLTIPIKDGELIQVGTSLQPEEIILESYRETFGTAFMVMVACGGLFGFLLARKAMSGVQRVTDTAT